MDATLIELWISPQKMRAKTEVQNERKYPQNERKYPQNERKSNLGTNPKILVG